MVNGKASLARGKSPANVNRGELIIVLFSQNGGTILDYGRRLVVGYRCIGQFMDVEHHA